jgi:(p)ppGpp synthase/HD superfamily hydrolase
MNTEEELCLIIEIAVNAHSGVKRRDGSDYINHPARVANYLTHRHFAFGGLLRGAISEELVPKYRLMIGAAYLHDVIEDTVETYQSLRDKGVSEDILDIVNLLTKSPDVRYDSYIRLIAQNPIAKLVKIADILDNLSDSPTPKQIQKYATALTILNEK